MMLDLLGSLGRGNAQKAPEKGVQAGSGVGDKPHSTVIAVSGGLGVHAGGLGISPVSVLAGR